MTYGYGYIAEKAFNGELPKLSKYLIQIHHEMAEAVGQKMWANMSANDFQMYLEGMTDQEFEEMAEAGLWDELENI